MKKDERCIAVWVALKVSPDIVKWHKWSCYSSELSPTLDDRSVVMQKFIPVGVVCEKFGAYPIPRENIDQLLSKCVGTKHLFKTAALI
jgi:hypothetical protein